MSNDLNNCNFIGRLGKDPETRYMPSGDCIASFSLAVGSTFKNKNGEQVDSTEWVNITAFGKLGEVCGKYLSKGSQVFISGRMKTEKYTDKQGAEKYSTKIIAEKMQMLGGKKEAPQQEEMHEDAKKFDKATEQVGAKRMAEKPQVNFDDMDDDIPF